jgi:hypothetical protein
MNPDTLRDHRQPCACDDCWHLQLPTLPQRARDRVETRYWPVETD